MVADPTPRTDFTTRRARILGPIQLVRARSKSRGKSRAVLLVLASYADADTLTVRIGRTRLGNETGYSRSSLRRAIRDLVDDLQELDEIEVGTGDRPSVYRLTLSTTGDNPVETATVPEREGVQAEPGGGSQRTREGVQAEPQPVVTGIDREGGTFPDHCPGHATVENPPPCRGCGMTREANEAARSAAAKAAKDETRRREADETRRRIDALDASSTPPPDWFKARRRTP